jgi:hypothetical protein
MKYTFFKALFPSASKIDKKEKNKKQIYFSLEDADVYLPEDSLTNREKILVSFLENKINADKKILGKNPWRKYFFEKGKKPVCKDSKVRFLYFFVDEKDQIRKQKLAEIFTSFFNINKATYFWIDSKSFVVIDFDRSLTKADFLGIIDTISQDFEKEIRLFIGLTWEKTDELREVFQEEKQIANMAAKDYKVSDLPKSAIKYYVYHSKENSIILNTYKTKILKENGLSILIEKLYENGGNITKTAKEMFIHRNTLEYRLNKLQKLTNLDLRLIDDLVFCYLLIV